MSSKGVQFVVAAALAALLADDAVAQSWPSKPVTYIVPFNAGSGPDVLARNISSELTSAKRFPPLSSRAAS
jgi:tripartite-type tricarboxylate transporter receptor subunit TctC